MDGYLLVDKPAGWTSHDVVAKIRGQLKRETGQKIKVGHSGTLDPMATGLLVILLGSYCKRADEFSKLDKTYEAELTLGGTSPTDDSEAEITKISAQQPTDKQLKAVLDKFVGQIRQVPPAFSAVKVGGQRAYKLARQGKTPEIKPRLVRVYELKNVVYSYPKLKFTASVSSGTYIRSLARDIGNQLGTGAYLSGLKRTEVGKYKIANAKEVDGDLTKLSLSIKI